jgi:hypothetical protein
MGVVSSISKLLSKMKITMPWLETMIVNQRNAQVLGGWIRLYKKTSCMD